MYFPIFGCIAKVIFMSSRIVNQHSNGMNNNWDKIYTEALVQALLLTFPLITKRHLPLHSSSHLRQSTSTQSTSILFDSSRLIYTPFYYCRWSFTFHLLPAVLKLLMPVVYQSFESICYYDT